MSEDNTNGQEQNQSPDLDVTGQQNAGDPAHLILTIGRFAITAIMALLTIKVLFNGKIFGALVGVGMAAMCWRLAPFAWRLGDRFRQFVRPDFYLASGALDLFSKRIFWIIGPQCVALLLLLLIGFLLLDKTSGGFFLTSKNSLDIMDEQREQAVAETKAKVLKLMESAEDYPEWTDTFAKQRDAYVKALEPCQQLSQGELESYDDFKKRQKNEKQKIIKKFGKGIVGKYFLMKNNALISYMEFDVGDEKLHLQILNDQSISGSGYDFSTYNILGTCYFSPKLDIEKFSVKAAKKLMSTAGVETFKDTEVLNKALRVDTVITVDEYQGDIKTIGWSITKRGRKDAIPDPRNRSH
jgi:hypothetical protein